MSGSGAISSNSPMRSLSVNANEGHSRNALSSSVGKEKSQTTSSLILHGSSTSASSLGPAPAPDMSSLATCADARLLSPIVAINDRIPRSRASARLRMITFRPA